MDSKINFNNYEESDANNELPIFSPPNRTKADKENVPDFLRVLDPKVYNKIQEQNASLAEHQNQTQKKSKKDEEHVANAVVKHTLETNHVYFPGQCKFVISCTHYKSHRRNLLFLFLFSIQNEFSQIMVQQL